MHNSIWITKGKLRNTLIEKKTQLKVKYVLECDDFTYGKNCQFTCGNCFDGNVCHHVNGTCSNGCAAGYVGVKCQKGR